MGFVAAAILFVALLSCAVVLLAVMIRHRDPSLALFGAWDALLSVSAVLFHFVIAGLLIAFVAACMAGWARLPADVEEGQ